MALRGKMSKAGSAGPPGTTHRLLPDGRPTTGQAAVKRGHVGCGWIVPSGEGRAGKRIGTDVRHPKT